MDYKVAERLWRSITNYADTYSELQARQSHPQFYNEKEAGELIVKLASYRAALASTFHEATGWWPVWISEEDRWSTVLEQ